MLTVNCIDVVTGSCRPFVRLVQKQHVYKLDVFSVGVIIGELFLCFACASTTVMIFSYIMY